MSNQRWTLSYQAVGDHNAWIVDGPGVEDEIDVIPATELEQAVAAAQAFAEVLRTIATGSHYRDDELAQEGP